MRIVGIAGKHFDGDRMPVLVTEEADDNLQLPSFAIAIVAKRGQFVVCAFPGTRNGISPLKGA